MSVESIITENLDIWTSAIKTKSALGRGSSKKLELYGIKKLRELILELAIRGKLVPQDTSEEPTSQLLKTIELNKLKLVKDKKIRKPKALHAIEEAELPFPIPSSWSYVRLNSIGDWGSGSTPKRSISEYYGGEIPWFKSGELSADYIHTSEETVTERALEETSLRYNNIGDVLIAMYGATIGKTSILNVRGATNQAVCACTPFDGVVNTYLLLLLKAYKSRFIGMGAGGAQPNISREKIISTVVPLPPQIEQKRIVSKVEELMDLCNQLESQTEASIEAHQTLVKSLLETLTNAKDADELNESWHRISAHFDVLFTTEDSIDQLKQTILQLAVMGKLVKQDPNDEPASKLLERIAADKEQLIKDRKIKKPKPLPQISKEALMDNLPKGWDVGRINDISVILDPNPSHRYPSYENGTVPLLSTREFSGEDGWQIRDAKLVPEDFYQYQKDLCDFNYRDLVFARKGRLGLARKLPDFDKFTFSHTIFIVKPLNEMNEDFLLVLFKRNKFIDGLMDEMNANVGVPTLGKAKLESMALGIPPKEEQFRIVKKVEKLMKLCDSISDKVSSLTILQNELANTLALEIFEEKK